MFSLAAFRYRAVLESDGGPISSVEEGEIAISGRNYSQANARLRETLVRRKERQIYSNADGSGLHPSAMVARHIAISEALERWAYYETVHSPKSACYGFHVDASSNGMAAFPGMSVTTARRAARFEAIERYCLLNWWELRIDGHRRETVWPGISAVAFTPEAGCVAVILFAKSDRGYYAYGHAAAESFQDACNRARLELLRHEWAIGSWIRLGTQRPPEDLFERRSWFFSTDAGRASFNERLATRVRRAAPSMEVLCDAEIPGPWSAYTTVWRYLLRPPSDDFILSDYRYFFW